MEGRTADHQRRALFSATSGGNLVTHAAVAEGHREILSRTTLGKAQVDAAGRVKTFDHVRETRQGHPSFLSGALPLANGQYRSIRSP